MTDEALDAGRRADRLLLAALLADEVQPDDDEIAALRKLDEDSSLQKTIPLRGGLTLERVVVERIGDRRDVYR